MMENSSDNLTIKQRVEIIKEKINNSAIKCGRKYDDITLVGVTKTQSVENIRELISAGVEIIGENKVQELIIKEPLLADLKHSTHLIGHLQRNKAKYLPTYVDMVQSIDDIKTIEALEKAYCNSNLKLEVLIEVNIGDEDSKNGVKTKDFEQITQRVLASDTLRLRGLMAIPPAVEGEAVRIYFEQMYNMFIDIKCKKMDNNNVNILSMGMSSDFEYAILEGATMVRVGTFLFGPRK